MILSLLLSIICGSLLVSGAAVPLQDIELVGKSQSFRIGEPDGKNNCYQVCPTTPAGQDPEYLCGTDGVTYDNPCLLLNANCKNHDIKLAYEGACDITRPLPPTSCGEKWTCIGPYSPVCGTDGKTYDNTCYFLIANCRDTSILFKSYGACYSPTPKLCKTTCNGHPMKPVCGTDNIIYRNQCELKNAACDNPDLKSKKCPGEVKPEKCSGVCHLTYQPKCGTDGKSYINQCHLDLNTCINPKITLAYDGACTPTPEPSTGCTGEEVEDYFCGSDGVTYKSACAFNEALKQACPPTLRLEHSGKCNCFEKCDFSKSDPVCGSDNITYKSACAFRVATCANPEVKLVSTGECRNH